MPQEFYKDPQAVLDYTVDWAKWLATSDTIQTSTWTVPSGITKDSDTNTDSTAVIWLSGGTADVSYDLLNHIVCDSGREDERTITVTCRNK